MLLVNIIQIILTEKGIKMKARKESIITVDMDINEAEALMHCMNKVLSDRTYIDVLPDNKRTESSLKAFMDEVRGLI